MSAAEKMRALDEAHRDGLDVLVPDIIMDALPQIVAVVEACEYEAASGCEPCMDALAALESALS